MESQIKTFSNQIPKTLKLTRTIIPCSSNSLVNFYKPHHRPRSHLHLPNTHHAEGIPIQRRLSTTITTTTISGGATNPPSRNRRTSDDDKAIVKKTGDQKYGGGVWLKRLLHVPGVNPTLFDAYEQNEVAVMNELSKIVTVKERCSAVKANFSVFVGGKLLGGLEEIMGSHISGELVPRLREAGAL